MPPLLDARDADGGPISGAGCLDDATVPGLLLFLAKHRAGLRDQGIGARTRLSGRSAATRGRKSHARRSAIASCRMRQRRLACNGTRDRRDAIVSPGLVTLGRPPPKPSGRNERGQRRHLPVPAHSIAGWRLRSFRFRARGSTVHILTWPCFSVRTRWLPFKT